MTDPAGAGDAQTRQHPLRRHLVSLVLVAVIVTLSVSLIVKHAAADDDRALGASSPSASPSPSPDDVQPSLVDTAPDDGTVRVDEKGFENIRDIASERQVSWGAVVVNTSDEAAAAADLTVTFLDSTGKKPKAARFYEVASVSVVQPGGRVGIGGVAYVGDTAVAKVRVEVRTVKWWRPGRAAKPPSLTVSDVRSAWKGKGQHVPYWGGGKVGSYRDEKGDLHLTFRVDSTYDTLLERPIAMAVFRNAKGRIVGGSKHDYLGLDGAFPPGWSEQTMRVKYGPPDNADPSKTEVYAYGQIR